MLLFEFTINCNGQQFYLRNSFLVKIRYSDRMSFHVDNIMAALSSSEKEVYVFQQKTRKHQFTLINMCKK
jgi:hypothetical protein